MAESAPPKTWTEMLAIKTLGNDKFETVHPPQKMGNALPIAYGGFALASAVKAAYLTLPPPSATSPPYHLYTISGNYLGPARIDAPLLTTVRTIRQTRTFATRYIEVSQSQPDGSNRPVLVALADFQVAEKESLLTYSAPPSKKYSHYEELEDGVVQAEKMVEKGIVGQKVVDMQVKSFRLMKELFETRPCPEGIFAQNLTGVAKHLPTTQDSLPIYQKSTADWMKSRSSFPSSSPSSPQTQTSEIENVSLLAFVMDGALAFAPLAFNHMFLDDSSATSSLDFSFRVFSNSVDMGQWHLREIVTHVGAGGRTYSEGRLWDEGGECVGSMTQQCIMRPKKKRSAEKGKL